jgi:6-pyruvoyltetrahydropterin/6-carboxytetrahydropterin synthase
MSQIRITKEFSFEAAHALKGYDGPCSNIHGHSYMLSVTVSGIPVEDPHSPKLGMVMDFSDLKKIIKENIIDPFDHSLILPSGHKDLNLPGTIDVFSKVIYTEYQPTTENMLLDFASRISSLLPTGIRLFSLRLRETSSPYVEWYSEDP